MEVLKKHKDETFLVPSSDIHKQSMFEMLDKEGIEYNRAMIYKTVASNLSELEINNYDVIIFFSPAGVQSLRKNFPDYQQNSSLIAAFGPTTAKAIKEAGLRLDIPAPTKSAPSMAMALDQYLTNLAKENRKNGKK